MPEPFAAVFQPEKVKPVRAKVPLFVASVVTAAEVLATVAFGAVPEEEPFAS